MEISMFKIFWSILSAQIVTAAQPEDQFNNVKTSIFFATNVFINHQHAQFVTNWHGQALKEVFLLKMFSPLLISLVALKIMDVKLQ